MNISVKKFSKKSLSLLIALIMVFSALPLTPPISADAATSTIQMTAMGCFRNGNAQRVGGDYISVCNDSQNTNFDIAVFNFNISSLSFKTYDEVSAMFNYYTQFTQSENKGVSFYYPTENLSEFEIANKYQGQPNTSIWTADDGNHLSRAISYYGLQPLQLGITTSSTKTTGNLDIGAAIKFAKLQGNSIATAVAVIASAGQSAQTGGWTDTSVGYSSKSVTVNITEVSAKEYVKQNIDNVKTSYPNISENNAGSFASNLVVADSWGSRAVNNFAVDNDKNNDDTIKVHGYSNAVAIYTGSNNVKFPVVLEKVANSDQSNKFDLYQQIEHVALENGGSFSLGSTWEYCNSSTDFTSKALTTASGDYVRNISSNINTTLTTDQGNGSDINTAKNDKFATELGKSFKNYIAYNGTGNTSSYYDKLAAPVFDYQADYAVYYAEVGFWGDYTWKITYVNSFNQNLPSNGNYYVINMKPLLDITTNPTFKSNFSNVYNNESKYETASLNAYYQTMADIVAFDLTSRGLDTEQKIASVAEEIKDLVDRYKLPELDKCTVIFKKSDLNDIFALPYTVKTVEIEKGATVATGDFPELTATHYDKDNKHYEYYWLNTSSNEKFTSSTIVNSNIEVEERRRLEACTFDPNDATCMSKAVCKVCGEPVGDLKPHSYKKETFVDAVGDNNSYTKYTCTMCGQEDETVKARDYTDQSSYWETYRALRAQAKDKIAENAATNGAKYTSASINALENAIARVREEEVCDKTKSQSYIENENTILRVATNELKLNQYSITVKYVDELGNDLKVGENGATSKTYPAVDYGSIQNVVAPTNYNKVDYAVYKWTRKGTNGDIISGLNSSSLDVVVKGASTYYVFLKNTSVDDTKVGKNAVITLNNKSGNIVDIGYVPMNQNGTETTATVTVDTNAGTIKIGDATLTAPKYSFYNLIGFEIGGIRVASGQTITLNSKMVIRPVYKAKQTVRITRATGSNFLINEQDVPSIDVEWNKKIVASTRGGSSVIWKAGVDYDGNGTIEDSEKNVVAYGSTYTFYSNSNVTIYTETSASAPAVPTASIGYFDYDSTLNKVTVVNNFYVPVGMTATKAGVILSTKSTLATMNNEERVNFLKAQTNGKFEGDESQFTTDKNQIRISVSRTAKTSFTMYALAYVVTDDGQTYYAPTVQSITYTVTNS